MCGLNMLSTTDVEVLPAKGLAARDSRLPTTPWSANKVGMEYSVFRTESTLAFCSILLSSM